MTDTLRSLFRELRFRTPLRRFSPSFHSYDYQFTPAQLAFFVHCVEQTSSVSGPILEIGCALGKTTLFLEQHLRATSDPRRYYCIDTFSGFVDDDISFEAAHRGKSRDLLDGFRVNRKEWFDLNLRDNDIDRVTTYQADIKKFDVAAVAPHFSFALLDVDLYQPIKAGLEKLVPLMAPGAILVVDDVAPNNTFDGAYQAYTEFVRETGRSPEIVHGKLGVIRAPQGDR
jgi:O-methyltransferase